MHIKEKDRERQRRKDKALKRSHAPASCRTRLKQTYRIDLLKQEVYLANYATSEEDTFSDCEV